MGSEILHLRNLLNFGKSAAANLLEIRIWVKKSFQCISQLKDSFERKSSQGEIFFYKFLIFKKTNLNFSIEILNIGWSGLTKDKSDEKPHQLHSGRRHTKTQQSPLVQSTMSMLLALMKIMIYFPTWLVQIKLFFK